MATIKEVEGYHDANVKTWECSACEEKFVYICAPHYCPECGEELDTIDVASITGSEAQESY